MLIILLKNGKIEGISNQVFNQLKLTINEIPKLEEILNDKQVNIISWNDEQFLINREKLLEFGGYQIIYFEAKEKINEHSIITEVSVEKTQEKILKEFPVEKSNIIKTFENNVDTEEKIEEKLDLESPSKTQSISEEPVLEVENKQLESELEAYKNLKLDLELETPALETKENPLTEDIQKIEEKLDLESPSKTQSISEEPVLEVENKQLELELEAYKNLKLDLELETPALETKENPLTEDIQKTEEKLDLESPSKTQSISEEPVLEVENKQLESELEASQKVLELELNLEKIIKQPEENQKTNSDFEKTVSNEEKINLTEKTGEEFLTHLETEKKIHKKIKVSFTDEEEIKILNYDENKIKKIIDQNLNQAAKEMGINKKILLEMFEELLEQIKQEKNNFYIYIQDINYEELHELAHKLKGASLNLRIESFATVLKYIDELSKEKKDINKIKNYIDKFYELLDKIKER